MYRKKEILIAIGCALAIIGLCFYLFFSSIKKENKINSYTTTEVIRIKIEGEVVRDMELVYTRPISYGVLFLRLEHNFNEYSDLTSFSCEEIIRNSLTIVIPTKDLNNQYAADERIFIHSATFEDLLKLPQIGEKRAQKILDYIQDYGKIDSWETFFKITSVPENAKIQIQQQAIL